VVTKEREKSPGAAEKPSSKCPCHNETVQQVTGHLHPITAPTCCDIPACKRPRAWRSVRRCAHLSTPSNTATIGEAKIPRGTSEAPRCSPKAPKTPIRAPTGRNPKVEPKKLARAPQQRYVHHPSHASRRPPPHHNCQPRPPHRNLQHKFLPRVPHEMAGSMPHN